MAKSRWKQRSDGRYGARIYLGRGDGGKKQYKMLYAATPKELEAKVREAKNTIDSGIKLQCSDTFAEVAEKYKLVYKHADDERYVANLKSALSHINMYIGGKRIDKIARSDIQYLLSCLARENPNTGRPAARRTLLYIKDVAFAVFKLAQDDNLIIKNPVADIELPDTATPQQRRALTADEQTHVREFVHPMQTAAMIMLYMGLRRGEVVPLQWRDIDMEQRCVVIAKSVKTSGGKFVQKPGAKSKAGQRVVPILDILYDYLQLTKRKLKPSPFDYVVFGDNSAEMILPARWASAWKSYQRGMNLQYGYTDEDRPSMYSRFKKQQIDTFTAHNLRHTYATNLYFAGIDTLTAKGLLGHSDIKTTLEIYTHLDAKFKRTRVDRLNEFFSKQQ